MTVKNEKVEPADSSEQADRHAILAAKVAESFRKILGPNFTQSIVLKTADRPVKEEEAKPFVRIQEEEADR